ncbi:MAG: DUF2807 domain-containing protein [Anaerolineales bacterium]|nr:DUF2807 domain-containing protein [Anaerolineales bacterium]
MKQKVSIFGPLLLIAAGVIWLLVGSGRLPSENLWALTRIWPYLLIVAGLGLILRAYWSYASIVVDVLIVGGAALAILFAPQLGWNSPFMNGVFSGNGFYIGPGEPGSGNVIIETRNIAEFNAIEVDYPAQVTVTQGSQVSVKVEAEDNVLPGLKTEVRNGQLRIFYEAGDGKHVNARKMVKVSIVVAELTDVEFDSAGELIVEGITTDRLEVSLSGAGNLRLVDITAKDLSVNLSGAGSMSASGAADDLDLNISGFGSFNGGDLHTQIASVTLSGAGSATIWTDDELDATISGAGSINYYGSPAVNRKISGVGNVRKSGDK